MMLVEGALSPLRLSAVTLRGIGPYVNGARLEIKPLTIVCGANGSGKSSWFKALKLVKDSLDSCAFPFRLQSEGAAAFYWGHVNKVVCDWFAPSIKDPLVAFIAQADRDGHAAPPWSDQAQDREFGPIATIGLEIQALRDHDLPEAVALLNHDLVVGRVPPEQSLLVHGRIPQGATYTIRYTCFPAGLKRRWTRKLGRKGAQERVELLIDGKSSLLFEKRIEERGYRYTCSAAMAEGMPASGGTLFGYVYPRRGRESGFCVEGADTGEAGIILERHCQLAIERIGQLTKLALGGYFAVGAIRDIYKKTYLKNAGKGNLSAPRGFADRYVGEKGEKASTLLFDFADNVIWDTREPYSGPLKQTISFFDAPAGILDELFNVEDHETESARARLRAFMPERLLTECSQSRNTTDHREQADQTADERFWHEIEVFLNGLLERRDLYEPKAWPKLPAVARLLVKRGVESIHQRDLRILNSYLLEAALPKSIRPLIQTTRFLLGDYYNMVMAAAVGVVIPRPNDTLAVDGAVSELVAAPLLENFAPTGLPRERDAEKQTGFVWDDGSGWASVSGERMPPGEFSAGFHQINPIVVQACLMRPGETMSVENPEVHLHPKLQLEIAGFLVRHAAAGKQVMIETHSDLVVRRVIRAILEEEIPEGLTSVNFVTFDRREMTSRIEGIEIDARGRIANWPEGFMDEDVLESRRLMNIMYPPAPADDWNE